MFLSGRAVSLLAAEVQTLRVGDRPRLLLAGAGAATLSFSNNNTDADTSSAGPSYSGEARPVLRSPHNRLEKGWGPPRAWVLPPRVLPRSECVCQLIYGFNKHSMPSEKILTLLFIVSFPFSFVNVL